MGTIDRDKEQEVHQEKIVHERIKYFLNKYMPEDREKAVDFEAELFMILRYIHIDISNVYVKQIAAMNHLNILTPKI